MIPRIAYSVLAYLFAGLALAGVVLPLVPTVPFLLLAAWCATRGSARMRRWLEEHPRLGPTLRQWERERAIPGRAKVVAVVLLCISWLLLAWRSTALLAPAAAAVLFVAVGSYIVSRPSPRAAAEPRD